MRYICMSKLRTRISRKFLILILLIYAGAFTPSPLVSAASESFTVATYNILSASRDNEFVSSDDWASRRSKVLSYVKNIDLVAAQEVHSEANQDDWIISKMKSAGYGTNSSKSARTIFWKESVFSVIKQGSKSIGSDGKNITWAKLKIKQTNQMVYFATVHLSVSNESDRKSEAEAATKYMKSNMTDAPIIFLGDMNSGPGSAADEAIKKAGFADLYQAASSKSNLDYGTTKPSSGSKPNKKIGSASKKRDKVDHIYVYTAKESKYKLTADSISIKINVVGSDHVPVEANLTISSDNETTSGSSSSNGSGSTSDGGSSEGDSGTNISLAAIPKISSGTLISNILNLTYYLAGIMSVGVIIFGGQKMITANGDTKRFSDGRMAILYAAIGLVVVVSAFSITNFMLGI